MASSAARFRTRRSCLLLLGLMALAAVFLARPVWHLAANALRDPDALAPLPPGHLDDASRLNQTRVADFLDVPSDLERAVPFLRQVLQRARRERRRVTISGSRHTMGGHTLIEDGLVVNMLPLAHLELDPKNDVLRAGAGATWDQVIPYLDGHGKSVAIMQSNDSFTIGGSLSANCHGWQHGRPPIAASVRSLRLLGADGELRRCSRDENQELFALVLGGYGLFGICLEAELQVVRNDCYRLERHTTTPDAYAADHARLVAGAADVGMAYGRLCIVPQELFGEAILSIFRIDPDHPPPPLDEPGLSGLRRTVFRASADSDYGKELRWNLERNLGEQIGQRCFSRNQLLDEGVEIFANRSAASTDILHEYFVPPARLGEFVAASKRICREHTANLLNVTVREVDTDHDSFLRYARQPMFALVMLFQQQRTAEGEARMQRLTRALIDQALAAGGTYYLPYRLHATPEQFRAAYPMANEFFARKRRYDPDELFQNRFYLRYGR